MPTLQRWIHALCAASVGGDVEQIVDALWLLQFLPDAAPAPAPEQVADAFAPASPPAPAGPAAAPAPAPAATEPGYARIDLPRPDASDARGVYALGEPAAEGALHARAVRVAGVPALRDAHALARALRPLGRRRPSPRALILDEEATVERYAETGALVPCFTPGRERCFDVLFLVEESPALPLWRGMVGELEALLSRRVGLRSLRRYALCAADGCTRARSRSGALADPAHLLEGRSPLVLLASDGTSALWSDGRMAATLAALGARAALAVLQLLPERLWPHTALGGAEWRVSSPRAGAANRDLRCEAPSWAAGADTACVVVPLVALQPPALALWAGMLMGQGRARGRAGMVWLEAAGEPGAADEPPAVRATPEALVARLRSVANARVLQAAIHLSAAAPLTLAVVRLVQSVMQPQAASEDLPLLLLSGLLVRRPAPAAGPQPRFGSDGDDTLVFDFADGVRELLQRSLLRHEAERVRHAVSNYIAERAGLPVSFSALVEDPQGEVVLPDWARPFAEINRQLDRLFGPRGAGAGADRIDELQLAPGVTARAAVEGLDGISQLAYAPDGRRIAVRHAAGVALFTLPVGGTRAGEPQREPVVLRHGADILFVKGWGVDEAQQEEVIATTRALLATLFHGRWEARYHTTPGPAAGRPPASKSEIRQLASLVRRTNSVVCLIGSDEFHDSVWARRLRVELEPRAGAEAQPRVQITCRPGSGGSNQAASWQIEIDRPSQRILLRGPSQQAALQLALQIRAHAGQWLGAVAFNSGTVGIAWRPARLPPGDGEPARAAPARLWVVEPFGQRVVSEGAPSDDLPLPPSLATTLALHAHPVHGALTLVAPGRVLVGDPSAGSIDVGAAFGEPGAAVRSNYDPHTSLPAFAWSPGGDRHAIAWRGGAVAVHDVQARPIWTGTISPSPRAAPALGWHPDGRELALADGEFDLRVVDTDSGASRSRRVGARIDALSWSPDGAQLAVATADGGIQLLAASLDGNPGAQWTAGVGGPPPSVRVAYSPAVLDGRFHELAVGCGHQLQWLRVDPVLVAAAAGAKAAAADAAAKAAAFVQAEAAAKAAAADAAANAQVDPAKSAAPSPATTTPAARPGDDIDAVEAALTVLQSMALAFHVGGLLPPDPSARRSVYEWLDAVDGEARNALRHWMRMSEYVFWGPVGKVLVTGEDPIAHWDAPANERACRRLLERWRKETEAPTRSAEFVAWSAGWLEVVADLLQRDDHHSLEVIGGERLVRYLDGLRQARRAAEAASEQRKPDVPAPDDATLQALEHELVPLLDTVPAVTAMRRYCGPFHELFATDGPSPFLRCPNYTDYLMQLLAYWKDASVRLFARAGANPSPPLVELGRAVPVAHLRFVMQSDPALGRAMSLGEPAYGAGPNRRPEHVWQVTRAGYVDLIDRLGTTVCDAVARRLRRPPRVPQVLWVDDRPQNNEFERRQLESRGITVHTAISSGEALVLLGRQPFEAVISDLGRPADPQAGYALLEAMRAAGHRSPFIVYTGDAAPGLDAAARAHGALAATDQADALLALLTRALLAGSSSGVA